MIASRFITPEEVVEIVQNCCAVLVDEEALAFAEIDDENEDEILRISWWTEKAGLTEHRFSKAANETVELRDGRILVLKGLVGLGLYDFTLLPLTAIQPIPTPLTP